MPTTVPCWDDDYRDYGGCNDDNDYHSNDSKTVVLTMKTEQPEETSVPRSRQSL